MKSHWQGSRWVWSQEEKKDEEGEELKVESHESSAWPSWFRARTGGSRETWRIKIRKAAAPSPDMTTMMMRKRKKKKKRKAKGFLLLWLLLLLFHHSSAQSDHPPSSSFLLAEKEDLTFKLCAKGVCLSVMSGSGTHCPFGILYPSKKHSEK